MAAQPKKKISKARGRRRFATKTYSFPTLSICKNCGVKKLPHTLCQACGYYNGRSVVAQKEEIKVTKVAK